MRKSLTCSAAALMMIWSAIAQAQAPKGAGGTGTGGGAAAQAAPAPAPAPAPAAPPPTVAPPAATPDTAPAEVAPQPVPPLAPEAAPVGPVAEAPEQPEEEEPPRQKRYKKKRRYVEEDELDEAGDEDDDDLEPTRARGSSWKLRGPHFVISAERLTSILSWSQSSESTVTLTDPGTGSSFTSTAESEESGTDVSLLSAGGFLENPFSIPRVGFDYMFGNGLTIGGSLGYMVTSGESEDKDSDGTTRTQDRPTVDIFLFAPRLGVFIGATPSLGIWLRGGVTRLALSSERDRANGDGTMTRTTYTATFVDVTLDPQLVISPVPHVGITVGPTLDIGVAGSTETTGNTSTSADTELTASSYGVTAGLVALF